MKRKPVLEYPCRWLYKVIGDDREGLQRAVMETIGRQPCTISLSNSSRTGKYRCLIQQSWTLFSTPLRGK